ncbi:hypothetical protein NDU88_007302 [Pleurodeles waltl]|uniref:Secreted protein n=1 Tax=Pleurodeles waltl TaxID=8319 RepID=A0AAV7QPC8_PLEWA|nr:hypothetical protein NDU88_007302 [Pleurodeles waltl]
MHVIDKLRHLAWCCVLQCELGACELRQRQSIRRAVQLAPWDPASTVLLTVVRALLFKVLLLRWRAPVTLPCGAPLEFIEWARIKGIKLFEQDARCSIDTVTSNSLS